MVKQAVITQIREKIEEYDNWIRVAFQYGKSEFDMADTETDKAEKLLYQLSGSPDFMNQIGVDADFLKQLHPGYRLMFVYFDQKHMDDLEISIEREYRGRTRYSETLETIYKSYDLYQKARDHLLDNLE